MNFHRVFLLAFPHRGPQLHRNLGRKGDEVICKVLNLRERQRLFKYFFGLHLFNQSRVLIDIEVSGLVNVSIIKYVLDSHLTFVILNKIIERYRRLEAYETTGKIKENR